LPPKSEEERDHAIKFFENKKHDFPQRIIYSNIKSDSLYARIEGMDKGKYRAVEFRMGKEKK